MNEMIHKFNNFLECKQSQKSLKIKTYKGTLSVLRILVHFHFLELKS